MDALISSPAMLGTFAAILVVEAASLLLLFLNVRIFRSQAEKYRLLLANLQGEGDWGRPGRILVPLYVILIFGTTVVTIWLFVFQPHLL